jgi:hypothetical protein
MMAIEALLMFAFKRAADFMMAAGKRLERGAL